MGALAAAFCLATFAVQLVLVAAVVVSWFPADPGAALESLRRGLVAVTEPIVEPVRRLAPPVRAGSLSIDVAPLVLLVVVTVVRGLIC
jgi:YggT family protein